MTELNFDEMEQDATQLPAAEQLDRLSQLVLEHLELEREINQIEYNLGLKKEELRKLNEISIPEIFHALNLEKFKLKNGAEIEVKKYYAGSISAEKEVACFNWLKDKGYDDLIKNNLILNFGKGEDEVCVQLAEALEEQGYNFVNKRSVHPSTLKAFIREHVESGDTDFPMELFNVFIGDKTKIKLKGGK